MCAADEAVPVAKRENVGGNHEGTPDELRVQGVSRSVTRTHHWSFRGGRFRVLRKTLEALEPEGPIIEFGLEQQSPEFTDSGNSQ